jgi:hypothetical protein
MNTVPEGSKVVHCMYCGEPINKLIRVDGQSATHCAPTPPSRQNRLDLIRAAALAAEAGRMRVHTPSPNRSGRRHL